MGQGRLHLIPLGEYLQIGGREGGARPPAKEWSGRAKATRLLADLSDCPPLCAPSFPPPTPNVGGALQTARAPRERRGERTGWGGGEEKRKELGKPITESSSAQGEGPTAAFGNLYFSLSFQRSFNHEELYNHNTKEYTSGRTQSHVPRQAAKGERGEGKQTEHATRPAARAQPGPQPSCPRAAPFMPASARPASCSTRAASPCPRCLCRAPHRACQGQRPALPSLQMDSQEHLQLSFEGAEAQKSEVTCKPQTELRCKPSVTSASMPAPHPGHDGCPAPPPSCDDAAHLG